MEDKSLLEILESDQWEIRLCTCSEVKKSASKKVKAACLKDKNEIVIKASSVMEDLK